MGAASLHNAALPSLASADQTSGLGCRLRLVVGRSTGVSWAAPIFSLFGNISAACCTIRKMLAKQARRAIDYSTWDFHVDQATFLSSTPYLAPNVGSRVFNFVLVCPAQGCNGRNPACSATAQSWSSPAPKFRSAAIATFQSTEVRARRT